MSKELTSSLDLASLPPEEKECLLRVGIELSGEGRGGTYLQFDQEVFQYQSWQEGLEVLSLAQARRLYPWVEDYLGRLLPEARPEDPEARGYFVRVLPGVEVHHPVQSSLFIAREGTRQEVHNLVIVEEGASLKLITGCASGACVRRGQHIGITETFIKRGGKLTFTMIHRWGEEVESTPQGAVWVEEGGTYIYNYICLSGAKKLVTNPSTYLAGAGAVVRSQSILLAPPGTSMDVGSRVYLRASDTKAELISRAITTGGEIVSRGLLVGEVAGVRGHLECHGLMLTPQGRILAVPELEARTANVELSHEAAVGKVAEEAVEYLMARGLDEEEALAVIVRGFLNVRIEGLPPALQEEIDRIIKVSAAGV
ncbi:SufB/SufD family protein [Ammonifex thiophilus]|uniref:SufD family Fe-S cluster assembly protein n=1 Tax=Ammonifex thiophilus TaxID=444093 RepID=A0A3D8P498_9THEO|nr:SufD family Fe-S cluster assembly protein [Ammonifex thiophilus]RDV82460.1 SufD family Fe-S cluster assembly protein [Ammonifex thiophilus]